MDDLKGFNFGTALANRLQDLEVYLREIAAIEQEAVAEELGRAKERLLHAEKDGIREAYLLGIICDRTSPGAPMTKNEKLLEAWDQLVKTISQKEGLSGDQAVQHVRKHFPELYDLYRQAKREKIAKESK